MNNREEEMSDLARLNLFAIQELFQNRELLSWRL